MIGVFDSGVGGLTVVKQIFKYLPDYKVCYFGDTARVPYGTRSPEVIKEYAIQDVDFLLKKGAKIIVIACHTVSSVAAPFLREKYKNVPIFDVVEPEALAVTKTKRIGVIGTAATIRSGAHEKLFKKLDPKIKVYSQACPLFVPLVEEGWIKTPETRRIVKKYLRPLKDQQIDTLVLACTHYPMLADIIASVMGKKVKIVDPAHGVVLQLKKYIDEHKFALVKGKDHEFYASDVGGRFLEIAKRILNRDIKVEKVHV